MKIVLGSIKPTKANIYDQLFERLQVYTFLFPFVLLYKITP